MGAALAVLLVAVVVLCTIVVFVSATRTTLTKNRTERRSGQ